MGCTEVAAAYRSHNDDFRIGGDWYDLIDRADNQVVAIVGDVVGHGAKQIGVMGQLRAASNALGRICGEPHELLSSLDAFARDVPGAAMATMAVVMLDGTTTARIASAGHPPVVHVTSDGSFSPIELGRRAPLTVESAGAATASFTYEVDDLLIMFTDGLVERRDTSYDTMLNQLGELVAENRSASCADIAAKVIDSMGADASDDVALLILRPRNHRAPGFLLQPQDPPFVTVL